MATTEEKKNTLLNLRKFDFSNNNSNSATFKLKKEQYSMTVSKKHNSRTKPSLLWPALYHCTFTASF